MGVSVRAQYVFMAELDKSLAKFSHDVFPRLISLLLLICCDNCDAPTDWAEFNLSDCYSCSRSQLDKCDSNW